MAKRQMTAEQRERWNAYHRRWEAENREKVLEYRRKSALKRAYRLVEEDSKRGETTNER